MLTNCPVYPIQTCRESGCTHLQNMNRYFDEIFDELKYVDQWDFPEYEESGTHRTGMLLVVTYFPWLKGRQMKEVISFLREPLMKKLKAWGHYHAYRV